MRKWHVLVGVLVVVAGCTQPNPSEDSRQESGSIVQVEDGDGGSVALELAKGNGAIAGHVRNEAGDGLPGIKVDLLGTDNVSSTNATGWFQFLSLEPGVHRVRAAAEGYRAAESNVDVVAGRVSRIVVTLIRADDVDPGFVSHTHDYWGGRTEVVVMDEEFDFHRTTVPPPYNAVYPTLGKATQTLSRECVPEGETYLAGSNSPIFFADPAQTVWPGTAQIRVSISWAPTDYVGAATVGFAWKPANTGDWTLSPPLRSGQPFTIDVSPEEADPAHHRFTLWEFAVCLAGRGESIQTWNVGRWFLGSFHAEMTLVKGHDIVVDPPHPRFWANGTVIEIVNETKTIRCPGIESGCVSSATSGRLAFPDRFVFRPTLVPPATDEIRLELSWTCSVPTMTKALGLSYSPANVPPREKKDYSRYVVAEPWESKPGFRAYSIPVAEGENDAFYQTTSNWAFLWGYEGEERDPYYANACQGDFLIVARADALRLHGPS